MAASERYEILSEIARGEFAAVYRARDTVLAREVAIKQIHQQYLDEPRRLERFWKEAQLLASLQHPNIVTIYDIDPSRGWLILELMQGSLAQGARRGPIDLSYLRFVMVCCLNALRFLHSRGVIHGDVKPSNMLVDSQNRVKLGDFGLARRVSDEQGSMLKGTTKYMAPEVVSDQFGPVGPASDIYALGFSAYELMCGPDFESLFPGLDAFGRDRQIAWLMWHASPDRNLPEIARVLEGVPEDLAAVVQRMIVKDQSRRLPSAQRALSGLSGQVPRLPHEEDDEEESKRKAAEAEEAKRKKRLRIVAAAAVVCSLVLSSLMLFSGKKPPPPTPPLDMQCEGVFHHADRSYLSYWPRGGGPIESVHVPSASGLNALKKGDWFEAYADGSTVRQIRPLSADAFRGSIVAVEAAREDAGGRESQGPRVVLKVEGNDAAREFTAAAWVPVIFNEEEPESRHGITPADLKAGDEVELHFVRREAREAAAGEGAEALPQDAGEREPRHELQVTFLDVRRLMTTEGVVAEILERQNALYVKPSSGAEKRVRRRLAPDCRIQINGERETAGRAYGLADLRVGDRVVLCHHATAVRVDALRPVVATVTASSSDRREAEGSDRVTLRVEGAGQTTELDLGPESEISLLLPQGKREPIAPADVHVGDGLTLDYTVEEGGPCRIGAILVTRAPNPRRRAIIIGVQDYDDPSIPPPACAVDDARLLHRRLVGRYRVPEAQAELVLNPSRDRLEQVVSDRLGKLKADDTLVVYFAGHASQGERGECYLAAEDCDLSKIAESGIALTWLLDQIERCPAAQKLLLLDSCRRTGGSEGRAEPSTAEMIETALGRADSPGLRTVSVIAVRTAGPQGGGPGGNGLFAQCLADGLSGRADRNHDERLEPTELYDYLKDAMASLSKEVGHEQTPALFRPKEAKPPGPIEQVRTAIGELSRVYGHREIEASDFSKTYGEARRLVPPDEAELSYYLDLAYGLLLLERRGDEIADRNTASHFEAMTKDYPDRFLPRVVSAWLALEKVSGRKSTCEQGIKDLVEAIEIVAKPGPEGEPDGDLLRSVLDLAGRLRQYAAPAEEDGQPQALERKAFCAPTSMLEALDAIVRSRGGSAEEAYQGGKDHVVDVIAQSDRKIAAANNPFDKIRLGKEKHRLDRYAEFPIGVAVQEVRAWVDRSR